MKEAVGATARVETAHQDIPTRISYMESLGAKGDVSPIADFIQAYVRDDTRLEIPSKRPSSLEEVTPAKRVLSPDEEKRAVEALVAAVKVCYRSSEFQAVSDVLRRDSFPEYVKVEIIWACERLGWAAPLRGWMPNSTETCTTGTRKMALDRMDGKLRDTMAPVLSIAPPQRPAVPRPESPRTSPARLTGRL